MEVLYDLNENFNLPESVLTMGSYDGIHRGHHIILTSLVSHSNAVGIPSVLITFNPHPRHVLDKKSKKLPLLMSIHEKLQIFENIGLDYVCIMSFTKKIADTSANEFLQNYVMPFFQPKCIMVGYDHHFGKNREGNPNFLKNFCSKQSIELKIISPISDDGHNFSSTRIRKLLEEGFVRRANFELGSIYGFQAKVIRGSGRGKNLDFPTANIIPIQNNQIMPKCGVYFIRGRIIGHHMFGMCNFGVRPTFKESDLVMEIHFFDYISDDFYGQEIRVEFLERIRDEEKFPSPEKLIEQLKIDKQVCLDLKGKYE